MTASSPFVDLHGELAAVADDLLAAHAAPAAGGDGAGAEALWRAGAEAGWFGLEVPEALGGSGATFAETAVVGEALGRHVAAGGFLGTTLGIGALLAATPGPRRDALLTAVGAGEVRLAVATAAHSGLVDPGAAFAVSDGRLTGRAAFVVDAPVADVLILHARAGDDQSVLVVVDASDVDVAVVASVDATRTLGTVTTEGVTIVDDAVLPFARDPIAAMQVLQSRGAVAVAVDAMGVATAALDATVDYVQARQQFGRAIGSFQAVKHRCADMAVALRVGRELLDTAIATVAAGSHDVDAVSRAASYVTAAAVDIAGGAMQLHGGIGYTWESGVHVWLKRATLDRALFGSPADHRRRIARRWNETGADS